MQLDKHQKILQLLKIKVIAAAGVIVAVVVVTVGVIVAVVVVTIISFISSEFTLCLVISGTILHSLSGKMLLRVHSISRHYFLKLAVVWQMNYCYDCLTASMV
jgi:hypothetical protein